ncbi:hypothetical protein KIH74_10270 [Kineosporia sp. J2-2]|uniref:Uncharacterized protein n=1 Tax=Kineosporia corallincola TaxID=2835133 RepID=A0ABS5TE08_9ACTN|nr:hypothetical protein [Kineosporia corallincola]MBT0769306.1 hypothetical protein [Kineosporia corallincola]
MSLPRTTGRSWWRRSALVVALVVTAGLTAQGAQAAAPRASGSRVAALPESSYIHISFVGANRQLRVLAAGESQMPGFTVAENSRTATFRLKNLQRSDTAFVNAADNRIWVHRSNGVDRQVAPGYPVQPGTSPSITSYDDLNPIIAFQDARTHDLIWVDGSGVPHDTGFEMMPGASPSITRNGLNIVIVFQRSADELLWRYEFQGTDPSRDFLTYAGIAGLGIQPGTNPSASGYAFSPAQIAFNGGNVEPHLWWIGTDNIGHDSGIPIERDSSPAMVTTSRNEHWIAFKRATDHALWGLNTDTGQLRYIGNGLGVAPGTSPAAAAPLGLGTFYTAFQAAGVNTLWTVDGSNTNHDLGINMMPGTSPSIAG